MILEFSVKNFLSFKDKVTFSMIGNANSGLDNNYMLLKEKRVLKTAAIYGPNASGKSNLFKILTTIIRDVSCVDYVENSFPFSLLNFNTYHLRRKFIYYINNLTVSACPPSPLLPSASRCQFSTGFPH